MLVDVNASTSIKHLQKATDYPKASSLASLKIVKGIYGLVHGTD